MPLNLITYSECRMFNPHCNENPIYVFLFWELRGLSPNVIHSCHSFMSFMAFMCLWAIYIFPGSICLFCCRKYSMWIVDRSWEYVNRSQTHECENCDCDRAISFMEIFVSMFRYWFFAVLRRILYKLPRLVDDVQ